MITWKQEGSTWVGYIGEKKVFEINEMSPDSKNKWLDGPSLKIYAPDKQKEEGIYTDLPDAKQAAEDFAAEMKQLFNTKEL